MTTLEQISKNLKSHYKNVDDALLHKAYDFMVKSHDGQMRASGNPFYTHPLEVAHILSEMNFDVATIVSAMLHDTLEDTNATAEVIVELFGSEIYNLVDGVTQITRIEGTTKEEHQAETMRKIILSTAKDIRVIIIKLADRLHNMRTLSYLKPEQQREISRETMDIYVPLANRLGMGKFKWEFEDLAFQYLYPDMFQEISKNVNRVRKERGKYIEEARKIVATHLKEHKIPATINGRAKHFFSIYEKMKKQGISFSEVYDLFGLRIITKTVRDCYAALGVIHTLWRPIPGRFKDYLAMPKPNRYQSIHTTVIGPQGSPLEIQIRTQEMHRIGEHGIAAHWHYKEGEKAPEEYSEIIRWLRQVMEWQQEMDSPLEFMESLKIDLFTDEVYVFTPKGKPMTFPRGATPIDFAYAIHTEIGHSCVGAKVNGKLVPLKYQLRSGDIVEIQTAKNHAPPPEWLTIAKTTRAMNKIRHFHKIREREIYLVIGKEMFSKEAKRLKYNPKKLLESPELDALLEHAGVKKTDDLLIAIGYGKLTARNVVEKLAIPGDLPKDQPPPLPEETPPRVPDKEISTSGIRIEGVDNVLIRLARCCNPIPGDYIKGFVTQGRGISVHRANCVNFLKIESKTGRIIDVFWDTEKEFKYPVIISIEGQDRHGLLADITSVISKENVNIISERMRATDDKRALGWFTIEVPGVAQLEHLLTALKNIKGVLDVKRGCENDGKF